MGIVKNYFQNSVRVKDALTVQRRVYGLKCTLAVLTVLTLLGLLTNIVFPLQATETGIRIALLTQVSMIIGLMALFYFLTEKRYNLILILLALLFVGFYPIQDYANSLGMDVSFVLQHRGEWVTDMFLFPLLMVAASGLLLRPGITAALAILLAVQVGGVQIPILLDPEIRISFNYIEIFSEIKVLDGRQLVFGWLCFTIVTVSAVTLAWLVQKSSIDAANAEKTNLALGRYFSPDIRKEIESSEFDLLQQAGREQQVAVLFTDIKGFTQLSEQMQPADVVEVLSEYQKRMVGPIFTNKGTVDKYIGDAVMATFGTPESRGNDAQNALDCARAMQVSLRQWNRERKEKDLPEIEHRIGIHVGPSIVGNIGGEERMEFTVVGDTVNVASRICDACKTHGRDVLISEDLRLRLDERLETEMFAEVEMRGRHEKMTLHGVTL